MQFCLKNPFNTKYALEIKNSLLFLLTFHSGLSTGVCGQKKHSII